MMLPRRQILQIPQQDVASCEKAFIVSRCPVRSKRNSWRPTYISRLPQELLVAVFGYATTGTDPRSHPERTLSHVCRSWRNLALGMSELWCFLQIWNLRSVRAYLRRSGTREISLLFPRVYLQAEVDKLQRLLKPHLYRISNCELTVFQTSMPALKQFLPFVNRAPNLRVSINYTVDSRELELPKFLPKGHIYPVRALELRNIFVPWDSHFFNGLQALFVSHPPRNTVPTYLPLAPLTFADILVSCPLLRELTLINVGLVDGPDRHSLPVVPCPNLRKIRLEDEDAALIHMVLSCVSVSDECDIDIFHHTYVQDIYHAAEVFMDVLPQCHVQHDPSGLAPLRSLSTSRSMSYDATSAPQTIVISASSDAAGRTPHFRVHLSFGSWSESYSDMEEDDAEDIDIQSSIVLAAFLEHFEELIEFSLEHLTIHDGRSSLKALEVFGMLRFQECHILSEGPSLYVANLKTPPRYNPYSGRRLDRDT